jgi:uncharacterized membrane protein
MVHRENIISLHGKDMPHWRRSGPNGKASSALLEIFSEERMNRNMFLSHLRAGLSGLPQQDADDIIRDYEAHFVDGAAAGRSEEEVAAALGDPDRLAKELRAEFSLQRLEKKDGMNIVAAVFALGGLATLDLFVLLPLALLVGGLAFVAALVLTVVGFIGVVQFLTMPWQTLDGITDVVALVLGSVGLIAAATSGGAFLLAGLGSSVRALGRYARLHYRLLQRTEAEGAQP